MKRHLLLLSLLLDAAGSASEHFAFVVPQPGGAKAQVILSEDLMPNPEVDVNLIGKSKFQLRGAAGTESELVLEKGTHAYLASVAGQGTRLIHGFSDLGLMERGGKTYLLAYYPKAIVGNAFDTSTVTGIQAPVEIVPMGRPGALTLKLLKDGKPGANAEITLILPDGTQKKVQTGANGETEPLTGIGRYGAWAPYWKPAEGERDGKKYTEVRNYATLVFDAGPAASSSNTATAFATMPQAASSFGAVASDGFLYVYGGHIAVTHTYSTEAVSGSFNRLKLAPGAKWQALPGGPSLQGMNLAAYGGKIYRIGGMTPRNQPKEKSDTFSVAECARFNPATMQWESLPSLPEPRSSHDAVVIGSKLIVAGGWTLKGAAGKTEWQDTLLVLDLSADHLAWKSEKQPFKRRALIAAAYAGKMYVIGGFDEQANVVRDVSIYDPATALWTNGPSLPGGEEDAFAPAACVNENGLYVSLADGTLYALKGNQWEKAGHATPRLAHRMVSQGKTVYVIGGALKGKNSDLVEAVDLSPLPH